MGQRGPKPGTPSPRNAGTKARAKQFNLQKLTPPNHLTTPQRECFEELAQSLFDDRLTAGSDRFMVEVGAVLLAEFRADPTGMENTRQAQLLRVLANLGTTASQRPGSAAIDPVMIGTVPDLPGLDKEQRAKVIAIRQSHGVG